MNILEAINDWADAMEQVAKAARAISKIANVIAEQTQGLAANKVLAVEAKEVVKAVPIEAKPAKEAKKPEAKAEESGVTFEQLKTLLAEKSQAGHTDQIRELLKKFGAVKISAVKPEDYQSLYLAAEEIK